MRLTKKRQALLDLIKRHHQPLSAEALLQLLPSGSIDLSTIYRNLDNFHQAGLLSKSVMEGRSYYYRVEGDHHHFMICLGCQKMIPIECKLDEMAHETAKKHGFTITHHDMTIYGYCRECQALNSKR